MLELIKQGDERGFWKIVYPDDWDEQAVLPRTGILDESQRCGRTDAEDFEQFNKDPNRILWKRIPLKNDSKPKFGEKIMKIIKNLAVGVFALIGLMANPSTC